MKPVPIIGVDDSADFFSLKQSPKSFLNPVNLKVFFDNYMEKNIPPIQKRFNLGTQTQIDSIIQYFNQIVKDQVEYQAYQGKYEETAFAKLIIKTLNSSFYQIEQKVPFELTSRYMAASMEIEKQDCSYFVSQAVTDPTRVQTICAANPFNVLQKLQPFVAPLFYPLDPTKRGLLKNLTSMTDAELNELFNYTNNLSLAGSYQNQTQLIHDFHGCKASQNFCSSYEIAAQQWGSSNITKAFYGPYTATQYLANTGTSAADIWGLFTSEPEYYFYANKFLSQAELF